MTQLFFDNFDGAALDPAWTSSVGSNHVGLSSVRSVSSPQSFGIATNGSLGNASRALGSAISTGYLAFELFKVSYLNGSTAGANFCIQMFDGITNAPQISLGIDEMGLATLYLGVYGGTVLGTFPMFVDVWHSIVFAAHIDAAAGWAQVAIDGQLMLDFAGNTQATSSATFDTIVLAGLAVNDAPNAAAFVDDLGAYDGLASTLTPTQSEPGWTDDFEIYSGFFTNCPWHNIGRNQFATTFPHSGAESLALNNGGYDTQFFRNIASLTSGSVEAQWQQVSVNSGNNWFILKDLIANAPQITVVLTTSGTHNVFLGSAQGTLLGTFSMGVDAFHLLAIALAVDPTNGSLSISVDGTQVFSFTGNTRSTANNLFHQVSFNGTSIGPSPPATAYIDDVAVTATLPILAASLWKGGGTVSPPAPKSAAQVLIMA